MNDHSVSEIEEKDSDQPLEDMNIEDNDLQNMAVDWDSRLETRG